jgi:hypothetical protein
MLNDRPRSTASQIFVVDGSTKRRKLITRIITEYRRVVQKIKLSNDPSTSLPLCRVRGPSTEAVFS